MAVYKDLYAQVVDEIEKRMRGAVPTSSVASTVSASKGETNSITAADLVKAMAVIVTDMGSLIKPRIISGLDVTATTPPSDSINITAGTATSQGKKWELLEDTTLQIQLNSDNYVFYIIISGNKSGEGVLQINTTHDDNQCEICKIIVPKPKITSAIVDDKPKDGDHGWIISAKDIVYDENTEFDDTSIEKLRDVIGPILADNLIGNIRLSENLKITNTQGSLELDSSSVNIISTAGKIIAKFNRNGTFFYNDNGREIAKFSTDEARVGNIKILQHSIQSGNFVSGSLGSGFQILDSGDAEFNNIKARGKLTSTVFEKETISSVGGNLLVSDSDVLAINMTALDTSTLEISGDTTFSGSNMLRMKDGVEDEWLEIIDDSSKPIYIVERDKANTYSPNNNPTWKKGTAVINFGSSGDGLVYMTASESNAPYLSVLTHAGIPWNTLTTHLRLGNLNGFLDYLTDSYGIGIGTSDAYLKYDPTNGLRIKGNVTITGGNASVTFYQAAEPTVGVKNGDYWVDTDDNNLLYNYQSGVWINVGATGGVETFRQSSIPTALNAGDLWIDTDDSKLYRATNVGDDQIIAGEWELQNAAVATGWSHTSDTTKIDGGDIYTGTITADKITVTQLSALTANLGTITAGSVTGTTIQTSGAGSRVVMDTSNLKAYDTYAENMFNLEMTGANAGDVTIGNYNSGAGMKWDRSAFQFNVKGAITATSGNFTGTMNVGMAGKVYLDGEREVIKVYDDSSNLRVELGKLS